jgi:integrase/recombinase XerD
MSVGADGHPLEHAASWLDAMALEQGSSPRTIEAYGRDLLRLHEYLTLHGSASPTAIDARLLRGFIHHLVDLGLAPASVSRMVSAVRGFYRFLVGESYMAHDPSEQLETPKKWRTLPDILTPDEVDRIIGSISLDERLAFRDRALFEVAYGAGLRVSEWITLGIGDIYMDERIVRVIGKGNKERLVPVGRRALAAVAIYLRELRPSLVHGAPTSTLFVNARGGTLSRMGAWKLLRKYVDAAGITTHVSPHTLRHTTAMHLLQSGVPFNVIALWLGHESTNTTHRYVEANLEMKEKALARLEAPDIKLKRYRASDDLMKFLQSL